MEIKFEWNTSKLENAQKDTIEKEIKQKILHHLKQFVDTPIKLLLVSLFDEKEGYQVTGAAVSIENGEKTEIIKNIRINPGFHMEFVKE